MSSKKYEKCYDTSFSHKANKALFVKSVPSVEPVKKQKSYYLTAFGRKVKISEREATSYPKEFIVYE